MVQKEATKITEEDHLDNNMGGYSGAFPKRNHINISFNFVRKTC